MTGRLRRNVARLRYLVIIIWLLVVLFPIYEMVITSLKSQVDAFSIPPKWFFVPILDNYLDVLMGAGFIRYLVNSLVQSLFTVFIGVSFAALAAYPMARRNFPGKVFFSSASFVMRMIPPVILVLPVFLMFRNLRILGSLSSLVLVYTALTIPFSIWVISTFISNVPISMEESAYMDGCNSWQTFTRIVLPLVTPALATAAIFTYRTAWNEFILSLVLTNRDTRTLPVAVSLYITDTGTDWGRITAIATIIAVPALIFTFTAARKMIAGITAGAVKG